MTRAGSILKQEEILDCAISLFKEKGLSNISTRELTSRLGLSRSHIYHYFANWDSLCLAALTRFLKTDFDELDMEIKGLPPQKALLTLIGYFFPDTINEEWLLYVEIWQLSARNKAYTELILAAFRNLENLTVEVINSGIKEGLFKAVKPDRMARQLISLCNGYADRLELKSSKASKKQAWTDIMDFLTQSLFTADVRKGTFN